MYKSNGTLDMRYSVSKIKKSKQIKNRKVFYLCVFIFYISALIGHRASVFYKDCKNPITVPIVDNPDFVKHTQSFKVKTISGVASWYGENPNECVGCRSDLLMANGVKYNEDNFTIASNDYALGQKVQVCHELTCLDVVVTDTGGFNDLGRVADLSKATKNVLGCDGLCDVTIRNTEPLKGF